MPARTPEGDALYERVLEQLDAEAVWQALAALPAPRAAETEEPADGERAAEGALVPTLVSDEVVEARVTGLPPRPRRRWSVLLPAVLAIGCLGGAVWWFPSARTEPVASADPAEVDVVPDTEADRLTAAAQAALDRVFGEGHSVVTVAAEYGDPVERWSERFGPTAIPTAEATARATATGPAGTGRYDARVTNNGVDRTVDHLVAAGRVTRLSVSVVVDAAVGPAPTVAAVQRWIGPAVGLQPRRGDQVSVVALPMASGRVVEPPTTRVVEPQVADYAPSVTAGLLALLFAGTAVRGLPAGRRRSRRAAESLG